MSDAEYGNAWGEASPEVPEYRKVAQSGKATQLWMITCHEGWRESIVCEGMYGWAADWLVEVLQGRPYAPDARPGRKETV